MKRSIADIEAAKLLLAHESADDGPAAAAVRVYERLSERLAPLIGTAGFEALVSRSVKLTKNEISCLEEFFVATTGELREPAESQSETADAQRTRLLVCLSKLDPESTTTTSIALYGTLLNLLKVFIGEELVWQVLRGAFRTLDKNVMKESGR